MVKMAKAPRKQISGNNSNNANRTNTGKGIYYMFFFAIMTAIVIFSLASFFGSDKTQDASQKITGQTITTDEPAAPEIESPAEIKPAKSLPVETKLNDPDLDKKPGFSIKTEIGDIKANALHIVDINKDNYPDMLIADVDRRAHLYLNNRKSEFGRSYDFEPTKVAAITSGDYDSDGSIDVVLGVSDDLNYIFYNKGDNSFNKLQRTILEPSKASRNSITSLSSADFNNDGKLDIAAGRDNADGNTLYINDGIANPKTFIMSPQFGEKRTQNIHFADFDNDGWLDVLSANYNDDSKVYFNRGTKKKRLFDEYNLTNSPGNFIRSASLCDLNRDGFVDVVSANYQQQNMIYLNDKDRTFTASPFTFDLRNSVQSICADFNNDNWSDIIIVNYNEKSYLYLNNKTGFFRQELNVPGNINLIDKADFNNDGFMDLVVGRYDGKTDIWLNTLGKTY